MDDGLLLTKRIPNLGNPLRCAFQSSTRVRAPRAKGRMSLRPFWRRQPSDVTPRTRLLDRTASVASRTGAWCAGTALSTAAAARAGRTRALAATRAAPRLDGRTLPWLAVGATAGACAMYFADPHAGRRRRALVRDRFMHLGRVLTRRVPLRVERRMRFMRGVATGVRHDAAALVHVDGGQALVDDETLVARVRSEVLRNRHVKAGEIHIDAYEGIVTLRGEVGAHEISDLVTATTHVEGVRGIRNYLHTPGTLPPNKADGYAPHPMPTRDG
jgi:hypothetical protein